MRSATMFPSSADSILEILHILCSTDSSVPLGKNVAQTATAPTSAEKCFVYLPQPSVSHPYIKINIMNPHYRTDWPDSPHLHIPVGSTSSCFVFPAPEFLFQCSPRHPNPQRRGGPRASYLSCETPGLPWRPWLWKTQNKSLNPLEYLYT